MPSNRLFIVAGRIYVIAPAAGTLVDPRLGENRRRTKYERPLRISDRVPAQAFMYRQRHYQCSNEAWTRRVGINHSRIQPHVEAFFSASTNARFLTERVSEEFMEEILISSRASP